MAGKLEKQLKKKHGFQSPQQAAVVGILRTADRFQYRKTQLFREYGITAPQYNILRILRGEGAPLPSLEVAARMITAVPGITRLIDRLEDAKLVSRERDSKDRRVWHVGLTKSGEKLVDKLNQPNLELESSLCRGLTVNQCRQLADLLEQARDGLQNLECT